MHPKYLCRAAQRHLSAFPSDHVVGAKCGDLVLVTTDNGLQRPARVGSGDRIE
jgi:hypothetical protein